MLRGAYGRIFNIARGPQDFKGCLDLFSSRWKGYCHRRTKAVRAAGIVPQGLASARADGAAVAAAPS